MVDRAPIAYALDFASAHEAREAALRVVPAIGMIKVGLELFVHEGP
ncbi:MAG: Orotidine 5-phosphate decarboxylase, partial [Myxococcaceae bacterium]|nr:Orotidine 5-phosphate decarboxylase [Myxococcaceae bacterium]